MGTNNRSKHNGDDAGLSAFDDLEPISVVSELELLPEWETHSGNQPQQQRFQQRQPHHTRQPPPQPQHGGAPRGYPPASGQPYGQAPQQHGQSHDPYAAYPPEQGGFAQPQHNYGYEQGYDPSHAHQGYPQQSHGQQSHGQQSHGQQSHGHQGYAHQGSPQQSHGQSGYAHQGYPQQGHEQSAYPQHEQGQHSPQRPAVPVSAGAFDDEEQTQMFDPDQPVGGLADDDLGGGYFDDPREATIFLSTSETDELELHDDDEEEGPYEDLEESSLDWTQDLSEEDLELAQEWEVGLRAQQEAPPPSSESSWVGRYSVPADLAIGGNPSPFGHHPPAGRPAEPESFASQSYAAQVPAREQVHRAPTRVAPMSPHAVATMTGGFSDLQPPSQNGAASAHPQHAAGFRPPADPQYLPEADPAMEESGPRERGQSGRVQVTDTLTGYQHASNLAHGAYGGAPSQQAPRPYPGQQRTPSHQEARHHGAPGPHEESLQAYGEFNYEEEESLATENNSGWSGYQDPQQGFEPYQSSGDRPATVGYEQNHYQSLPSPALPQPGGRPERSTAYPNGHPQGGFGPATQQGSGGYQQPNYQEYQGYPQGQHRQEYDESAYEQEEYDDGYGFGRDEERTPVDAVPHHFEPQLGHGPQTVGWEDPQGPRAGGRLASGFRYRNPDRNDPTAPSMPPNFAAQASQGYYLVEMPPQAPGTIAPGGPRPATAAGGFGTIPPAVVPRSAPTMGQGGVTGMSHMTQGGAPGYRMTGAGAGPLAVAPHVPALSTVGDIEDVSARRSGNKRLIFLGLMLVLAGGGTALVVQSGLFGGDDKTGGAASTAPAVATLTTVPAEVQVTVDGIPLATTQSPFTLELSPDQAHQVVVRKDGYKEATLPVSLGAGSTVALQTVTLQPANLETGVIIDSNPQGARIIVDGADTGQTTPARLTGMVEGMHAVRLLGPVRGNAHEVQVYVAKDQMLKLPLAELAGRGRGAGRMRAGTGMGTSGMGAGEPRQADLGMAARRQRPTGSAVGSVDDLLGGDSGRAARPAAAETRTRPSGLGDVGGGAGGPAAAAAPGGGPMGMLRLNARPWAQVFVDGRKVGNTPLMNQEIPAGAHTIKLVNPDLDMTKTLKIRVPAGQTVTKIVDLMD